MNLKESYRYAKFLDTLLTTANTFMCPGFFTTRTQKHLRSKADKEAVDETLVIEKPFVVDFTPMDVVDFSIKILSEKEALMDAIATAKAGLEINIDNAVSMNKKRQILARFMDSMVQIKPSTRTMQGTGYRFNMNNEQVAYFYEIEETTSIDFDRNNLRSLSRKLLKEADAVSARLDSIEIDTIVDFVPAWDVNDSFRDILDVWHNAAV